MRSLKFGLLIFLVITVQLPFYYPVIKECHDEGHSWYYCIILAG